MRPRGFNLSSFHLTGIHMKAPIRRAAYIAAAIVLGGLVSGCAGLGQRVEVAALPDSAPDASEILEDLARNDARIENFRGAGTFILESPDFDAVKKFRGNIKFRRPADLYVQGNHRITNIPLFKLTCVGQEFLMEFPGSRDRSFYRIEGEQYEDVAFSVSPSDIAREMFLPEDWGAIRPREARVVRYDTETNVATVAIGPRNEPRRLIDVMRVNPDDPSWVIARNTRIDKSAKVIAETNLDGYSAIDGTMFPTEIDAWFPTEETRMIFRMRNVQLNTALPDKDFDIRSRALELNLAASPEAAKGRDDPSFGRRGR